MNDDVEHKDDASPAENTAGTEATPGAENAPPEASALGLIDTFTAGGRLKAAREARGRTLDDVARELKISRRVLESIEQTTQPPDHDMRRTRLVAKTYANTLGIDPEPVLADFPMEEEKHLATAIPKSSVTVSERKRGKYLVPLAAVAGAAVAVGLSVVVLTPRQTADTRSNPSVAERVVAVNTAQESLFAEKPLSARPEEAMEFAIVATKPSWIEVRGSDGTIFRSRVMAKGEAYYPRVGAGWTVTVRDGSAFEWRIEEESIGSLSEEAVPLYSASIDDAAALAAERKSPALAATSNSRPAR